MGGPDISKYRVIVSNGFGAGIVGLMEKLDASEVPSSLAFVGRYILTPDIL